MHFWGGGGGGLFSEASQDETAMLVFLFHARCCYFQFDESQSRVAQETAGSGLLRRALSFALASPDFQSGWTSCKYLGRIYEMRICTCHDRLPLLPLPAGRSPRIRFIDHHFYLKHKCV